MLKKDNGRDKNKEKDKQKNSKRGNNVGLKKDKFNRIAARVNR